MSLEQKKNTITLKMKQVCATLRQQVHTSIAMVYTRMQSHITAYLNKKKYKKMITIGELLLDASMQVKHIYIYISA